MNHPYAGDKATRDGVDIIDGLDIIGYAGIHFLDLVGGGRIHSSGRHHRANADVHVHGGVDNVVNSAATSRNNAATDRQHFRVVLGGVICICIELAGDR